MRRFRLRLTIRRMMLLVAVVAVVLGLAFSVARAVRVPSDPAEALAHVQAQLGPFTGHDEVVVRRVAPGESVGSQYDGLFEVRFHWRERPGHKAQRLLVLVMEDGYCMQMAGDPNGQP